MRNYFPHIPNQGPVDTNKNYVFNAIVLRFTSEELAAHLNAEATREEADAKEIAPRAEKMIAEVKSRAERLDIGMSADDMVAAIRHSQETGIASSERKSRFLRFLASHLAKDAVFEFDWREFQNLGEEQYGVLRQGYARALGARLSEVQTKDRHPARPVEE